MRTEKHALRRLALTVLSALVMWALLKAQNTLPSTARQVVLISDLHMGIGHAEGVGGPWHPFEDFRWHDDFAAFLSAIDALGGGATDLVLVGDTFELWQSIDEFCAGGRAADIGCTSNQALARTRRVLQQHANDLELLHGFANSRSNRLIIVPGNHDAALELPAVREAVVRALSLGSRLDIPTTGYWLSSDKRIVAEHGHQIGADLNRFAHWPDVTSVADPTRMERTWGERFVDQYYNAYEAKYPIVDNILDNGVGAYYVARAEGTTGAAAGAARFVEFIATRLAKAHYDAMLGSSLVNEWDVAAVRERGAAFIDEMAPEGVPGQPRVSDASHASLPVTRLSEDEISDDEIRELCDARAAMQHQRDDVLFAVPELPLCPTQNLNAMSASLFSTEAKMVQARLREVSRSLDVAHPVEFELFVYGHTHTAVAPRSVMPSTDAWQPVVVNTGAWQRVVSVGDLKKLQCGRSARDVLAQTPEALPACYSAVIVPGGRPSDTQLRYWIPGQSGGAGQFATRCPVPACGR